jgi:hypothetical protein
MTPGFDIDMNAARLLRPVANLYLVPMQRTSLPMANRVAPYEQLRARFSGIKALAHRHTPLQDLGRRVHRNDCSSDVAGPPAMHTYSFGGKRMSKNTDSGPALSFMSIGS